MIRPVLYFQLHQPRRLRRFSIFDSDHNYFDDVTNERLCRSIADRCYRPATQLLTRLCNQHTGRFRCSLSISGSLLRQLSQYAPDVTEMLQELVGTGCCELLAETSHHSLASLYSPAEFAHQVHTHLASLAATFGVTPRVFRNTELIYSSDIARSVAALADSEGRPLFDGILTEGAPQLLGSLPTGHVYSPSGLPQLRLLTRDRTLSDDIAFRFGRRDWEGWPLTPAKYAKWVAQASEQSGTDGLVNIFLDFETFGEHQWAQTGIFEFLAAFPKALFDISKDATFLTPSMAIAQLPAAATLDCPTPISWADEGRDLSPWRGNAMQVHALEELYRLGNMLPQSTSDLPNASPNISENPDPHTPHTPTDYAAAINDWRDLTTSDHAYYMSTKGDADGAVHAYFRPYGSPYENYISFMNTLLALKPRLLTTPPPPQSADDQATHEVISATLPGPIPEPAQAR